MNANLLETLNELKQKRDELLAVVIGIDATISKLVGENSKLDVSFSMRNKEISSKSIFESHRTKKKNDAWKIAFDVAKNLIENRQGEGVSFNDIIEEYKKLGIFDVSIDSKKEESRIRARLFICTNRKNNLVNVKGRYYIANQDIREEKFNIIDHIRSAILSQIGDFTIQEICSQTNKTCPKETTIDKHQVSEVMYRMKKSSDSRIRTVRKFSPNSPAIYRIDRNEELML